MSLQRIFRICDEFSTYGMSMREILHNIIFAEFMMNVIYIYTYNEYVSSMSEILYIYSVNLRRIFLIYDEFVACMNGILHCLI